MSNVVKQSDENKRSSEWKAFFFITVVLFPILSVGVVGAYGSLYGSCRCCFLECLVTAVNS